MLASGGQHLGVPISDESDDDISQIRQLDEEKGIYPHPEVVVPPQTDSDEDIPIKGAEPPFAELLQKEEEALQRAAVLAESNPALDVTTSFRTNPSSDTIGLNRDEAEEIPLGKPTLDYPAGPPPAYDSDEEAGGPREANGHPGHFTGPKGGLASMDKELMLGNIAKPFQSMRQKIESDDEDSEESDGIGAESPPVRRSEPLWDEIRGVQATEDDHGTTPEERTLFAFITAFQPENVDIEPILKPFLLEFIPAVGDIDAFIKIPRPDEVEDNVGLTMLDEPAVKQSDPTILDMQMRSTVKEVGVQQEAPIKQLERADKNSDEIENWIKNIKEMHRSKPPATVHYSKPMPDIDRLMQEWPPEFEKALRGATLPTAELDVPLEEFVDLVLNFVDIPVGKSRIQSLHVLFTLFAEFKNSQHFRSLATAAPSAPTENTDRLEL